MLYNFIYASLGTAMGHLNQTWLGLAPGCATRNKPRIGQLESVLAWTLIRWMQV